MVRPRARARAARSSYAGRVGSTRIARDFFAGRYASVVARSFDAKGSPVSDSDVAFVVGALTFLGRRDDAQACFDAWKMRATEADGRTQAATRFFLGLAYARAGQFEQAYERLVRGVRARSSHADGWSQAFVFQGLAAYRYFTGRYHAAARHALRALRAAHAAGFSYAKLLANDLRGHALIQVGRMSAGTAVLEQARRLAGELGLELNAFAIDCSIAAYSLKFGLEPELLERLRALLAHPSHDSYSRHALLTEYAAQLAVRGRVTRAREALAQADREALRHDVRRAKLANLLAHLHVARWGDGARACGALLEQAKPWLDDADVTFRAELLGFEALVARAEGDAERLERALASLRSLAASHDLHWAKAALEQFSDAASPAPAFAEDRRTPLLRAVVARDEGSLSRLVAADFHGAIPELYGQVPGRRIWVLVNEDALVVEDHGDVSVRRHPPRWCPSLLQLLMHGDVSKEQLVTRLWGLRMYRPERHDPLLRTTIHRLRTFLEPYGAWVKVTESGYGCDVPMIFVGGSVSERAVEVELEDFGPEALPARAPAVALALVGTARVAERLCRYLTAHEAANVKQLARALGVSDSTALRALRSLVDEQRVERSGFARATRYSLRAQSE